ncbi:MAG: hypothetical protein M0Z42_12980, partial [Actinomycetota bacterium]|nr:hypothetical protein [Actinomycetota bacterium]
RLLTGATANPATVTVPYGGVTNATEVTFTNAVDYVQFKVCKRETSADANLAGVTFNFSDSYTTILSNGRTAADGQSFSLTIGTPTASNPTGEVCTGLSDPIPVVDPNGNPYPVKVTEGKTTTVGVESTVTVQGGTITSQTGGTANNPVLVSPAGTPNSVTFDPGPGIDVVTFTNGRT